MIHTRALLIGYFSLSESVVKLGLSALLIAALPDGFGRGEIKFKKSSLIKSIVLSEKFALSMSFIVGLAGIFFSLKLISGIKTRSTQHLMRWTLFQTLSIIVLTWNFFVVTEIVQNTRSLQRFDFVVYSCTVIYTLLQTYFLLSIVLMYFVLKESKSLTTESPLIEKLIKENV